jgi:hypothetical protein
MATDTVNLAAASTAHASDEALFMHFLALY